MLTIEDVFGRTGLDRIDTLLLTHFHRDQCGAAASWSGEGLDVYLPFAERKFFEEADLQRAAYDTYNNYTSYFPGFSSGTDVRGNYAYDYQTISSCGVELLVLPLPGHTFGSVGYLFEVAGTRYLACGDLMSAPGKVREYFWNQWRYMDFQGHVNLLESLERVRGLDVDVVLPGHGLPFTADEEAFGDLQSALEEIYELFYAERFCYYRPHFRQLSPHVVEVTNTSANTYVVHDNQGHGLLIDCGYTSAAPIAANPHRFVDHLTPYLEPELGIREIEWFLPSHYHDDHLAGLPALEVRYGTRVATSPELVDIVENPHRYEMPCAVPFQTQVARVVDRDEPFVWRGTEFRIEQFPGQTLYHQLITFELDGVRYLSIGDNISGVCLAQDRDFIHSFIPKNRTPVSSYSDMPRQIRQRAPDVLLTGHGGAIDANGEKVQRWQRWMDRWTDLFSRITDQPHADLGMDPHWVEFYPYKVRVTPGAEVVFEIRIKNHESVQRSCGLAIRATGGCEVNPPEDEFEIGAGETAALAVTARFPESFTTHSLVIIADVTWGDCHLGEIAEAVAFW